MYSRSVLVRLIQWQHMVKMVELGWTDVFFPVELNFIKVRKNFKFGILCNYLRELKLVVLCSI